MVAGLMTSVRITEDDALASQREGIECALCHQSCYFAAIECDCCPSRSACLAHASSLCACPPSRWRLAFRFSLADLERYVGVIAICAAQLGAPLKLS